MKRSRTASTVPASTLAGNIVHPIGYTESQESRGIPEAPIKEEKGSMLDSLRTNPLRSGVLIVGAGLLLWLGVQLALLPFCRGETGYRESEGACRFLVILPKPPIDPGDLIGIGGLNDAQPGDLRMQLIYVDDLVPDPHVPDAGSESVPNPELGLPDASSGNSTGQGTPKPPCPTAYTYGMFGSGWADWCPADQLNTQTILKPLETYEALALPTPMVVSAGTPEREGILHTIIPAVIEGPDATEVSYGWDAAPGHCYVVAAYVVGNPGTKYYSPVFGVVDGAPIINDLHFDTGGTNSTPNWRSEPPLATGNGVSAVGAAGCQDPQAHP